MSVRNGANHWEIVFYQQFRSAVGWKKSGSKPGPTGPPGHGSREPGHPSIDWIGLREILQDTIDFPIKYGAFL